LPQSNDRRATADAPAIRELRSDDLGSVAALLRRVRADNLFTERGVRHDVEAEPDRADAARWVAEQGGIVGYAVVMRYWWRETNDAYAWVGVTPDARGRGVGRSLADLVDEHLDALGVDGVYTDVVQDPAGERFVRARGFEVDRIDRVSVLDPRTTDLSGLAHRVEHASLDGYVLTTLDAVRDLHALYELALEVGDDMPSMGAPHSISFEEWQASLLDFPDLHPAASAVVVHNERPVAFSLLSVDLESRRSRNEETGTARAHRRRGLATLAKLATIGWAREHGIESILTDNAEVNAGMLAINARLGYRPLIVRTRWVKRLGG
jgi:GNAT superfamily N-acetyltransferase